MKIGDLGSAEKLPSSGSFKPKTATTWLYRAPEISEGSSFNESIESIIKVSTYIEIEGASFIVLFVKLILFILLIIGIYLIIKKKSYTSSLFLLTALILFLVLGNFP